MASQYLITGNDEFSIKAKAKAIITELCGEGYEDNPDLEIIHGDKEDSKVEEVLKDLLASLQTPPFLSDKKIIWMKNFLNFDLTKNSAKTAKGKAEFDACTALLKEGLPPDITLVINGPDLDKRSAFYKLFQKNGEITFLNKPDLASKEYSSNQRVRIKQICGEAGKSITEDAVEYLVSTVGSDTGRLNSELEKLCCYIGPEERITLVDCKHICSKTPEVLSWDFANALTERNLEKALDTVNILMEQMRASKGQSNHELSLLFAAIKNFQEMIKIKKAAAELRVPPRCGPNHFKSISPDLKKKYPDNVLLSYHPYRAFMVFKGASKFSDQELAGIVSALLTTNRQLVSGGADSRIALEQLLLKVCRPERRR